MQRKIKAMYKLFGESKGNNCKHCSNYRRYRYNDYYRRKCTVYGVTHSSATDWRGTYEACGMFNKEYRGNIVLGILKHKKRPKANEQIKGQISLKDFTRSEHNDL